jgi:hypothetical protein
MRAHLLIMRGERLLKGAWGGPQTADLILNLKVDMMDNDRSPLLQVFKDNNDIFELSLANSSFSFTSTAKFDHSLCEADKNDFVKIFQEFVK